MPVEFHSLGEAATLCQIAAAHVETGVLETLLHLRLIFMDVSFLRASTRCMCGAKLD